MKFKGIFLFVLIAFWSGSVYATKPLPPLKVNLEVMEPNPSLGDRVTFFLNFMITEGMFIPEGMKNAFKAKVLFEDQNLELLGQRDFVFDGVAIGEKKEIKIPARISHTGEVLLTAFVQISDEKGSLLFGRRSDLYFLIFADKILWGRGSFTELYIRKLEKDY